MTKLIYEPKGAAGEYAAWALNVYLRCGHGCKYCYVPQVLHVAREEFHQASQRSARFLERLDKEAAKRKDIEQRVLLCFTCDPYQPLEAELGITRKSIEILKAHGLNVTILSKAGMFATRDFDLLSPADGPFVGDAFAATLTYPDTPYGIEQSRQWEPNAALPIDRLSALAVAHDKGLWTWVSVEPVLEPEQSLAAMRLVSPFVSHFKIGKLNYHTLARSIDWRKFGQQAVELSKELGVPCYIKKDLAKEMGYDLLSGFWQ